MVVTAYLHRMRMDFRRFTVAANSPVSHVRGYRAILNGKSHMLRKAALAGILIFCPLTAWTQELPGFGNSKADPVGEKFVLPQGVTLDDPLFSHNMFDSENCKNEREKEQRNPPEGTAGLVALCLVFRYPQPQDSSEHPTRVFTLPHGLTFIPHNKRFQNAISVKRITVAIKVGETIYVPVRFVCMNPARKSNVNIIDVPYSIGPVVKNKRIEETFKLTDKYEIPFDDLALGNVILNIASESESNVQIAMQILREQMKSWRLKQPSDETTSSQ